MAPTWTDALEEQLISMIEERPPLYNISEKSYSNRVVRADCWRQITEQLNVSEKEVKKKWESLRTQFGRYRKPSPSGSSRTKRTARQRWILRKLQFLQPHTKTKESASDLTHTEPLASSDASSGDDAAADASVMDNNTDRTPRDPAGFESFSSGTSAESTRRPRAKRRRKSPNDSPTTTADLIRSMEAVLERMSAEAKRDFIAVTCQSIEHKFRMVPPHLLPRLENRVQNLIFNFFEEHNLGNHPDTHANGC